MKRIASLPLILFLATSFFFLAACTAVQTVEGSDAQNIQAAADPMARTILDGINKNDFALFTRDFGSGLLDSMKQKDFNDMYSEFSTRLGKLGEAKFIKIEQAGDYTNVVYEVKAEKSAKVDMRLIYMTGDTSKVAGFWFDAPELR